MRILFVDPYDRTLFSFRKELLDELIKNRYEIILCTTATKRVIDEYQNKVNKIIDVNVNLKDKGIFSNLKLKRQYRDIIKQFKPDLIISYTIKPNIYCALYSSNIPMIANVTGLGNMFKKNGFFSKLGIYLYRMSFKKVDYVFFQNEDGLSFFRNNKITINSYKIIPGSGVNLKLFTPSPIDRCNNEINFLFASRAIKEKGFDLLIDVIPLILDKYENAHFNFLSAEEDVYENQNARCVFDKYKDNVTILNRTDNMSDIYSKNDFLVAPSYYREGISNVLLESLACGRPIITTIDNPGCMEVLKDGINGFGVCSNDLKSLFDALSKAMCSSKEEIEKMGLAGREFVCKYFDRNIVINEYLLIIDEIACRNKK